MPVRSSTRFKYKGRFQKLPADFLNKEDWNEIAEIVEGGLIENILRQQQVNGASIKRNRPSTSLAKHKKGWPKLSLVDAGRRLVQRNRKSYKVEFGKTWMKMQPSDQKTKGVAGEENKSPQELVASTSEKGYGGWFGLSVATQTAIKGVLRDSIKRFFDKAKK